MKKWIALLLSLAIAGSLAGCGTDAGSETVTGSAESAAEQAQNQNITLTFWHCASDETGVLMEKYVRQFNETNESGITVKAVYQGQYSDATTLLKTMLSAQNYRELPDIMQMDATGKVAYSNSGKAYTVDDALTDHPDSDLLNRFLPGPLGNWQYSGCQLGLPFASSTTVTFCNMDLLEQAGWTTAPDTFADLIALSADLQSAGVDATVFQAVPSTPTLANWLGQLGSYLVNQRNGSDGIATELDCIEDGSLLTFLTEWKAMYDAGALVNENSSTDRFVAGEVAVMTASSSNIAAILERVGDAFAVGVSPYLRVNESASYGAGASGSCLVLFDSEDAARREAAWQFMQYLTSGSVQADYAANTGYIPACTDAMQTDIYAEAVSADSRFAVAYQQMLDTPAAMRSVTVGPSTDFYYAIMECVSDMLENGQTPEETVEIMRDTLTLLLDDYARNNS